jgi:predicted alpha/beta hydrolase family esterase
VGEKIIFMNTPRKIDEKSRAAIIHGRKLQGVIIPGGLRNMAFLPSLHQKLETLWFEVERPNLRQPENPTPDMWREELYELLKGRRLVVAYSMGTVMVLDTLSYYEDLTLDHLILVGCSWWSWEYLMNHPESMRNLKNRMNGFSPALSWLWTMYGNMVGQSFVDRMYAMQQASSILPHEIIRKVSSIVMLLSNNDRIVPLEHGLAQAEKLHAQVILCPEHGHFTRSGELWALTKYLESNLQT